MMIKDVDPRPYKPISPLRYPGGKGRIAPFIHELLDANGLLGCEFAESHAGGAGVGLALLDAGAISSLILNDLAFPVYAFWKTLSEKPDRLIAKIYDASLNMDEWERCRGILNSKVEHSLEEAAFALFYINRSSFGGLLGRNGRPTGRKETEIAPARWCTESVLRRIEHVAVLGSSISVHQKNAVDFLQYFLNGERNRFAFIDPPYFDSDKHRYLENMSWLQQYKLSGLLYKMSARWIVTLGDHRSARSMYHWAERYTYSVQYSIRSHAKSNELLVIPKGLKLPIGSRLPAINELLKEVRN